MEQNKLYIKARGFFEELSQIPRGSGNTDGISAWLQKWGRDRNLYVVRDVMGNVYMRRDETPDEDPILLQGHMDMVCEKDSGVKHDFNSDPIYLSEEDGKLTAIGTTLGADNGTGVALALAAMDSLDELKPVEALFTVDEEIGLLGAAGFDMENTTAERLVNIDSGGDNVVVVGSAGGEREKLTLFYDAIPAVNTPVLISIDGLKGGHSGTEIGAGNKNALCVMGRVLNDLYSARPFNLISLNGGLKGNAIPRSAECVIAAFDAEHVVERVAELEKIIKGEFAHGDPDAGTFRLRAEKIRQSRRGDYSDHSGKLTMLPPRDTGRVISLLTLAPNGVIRRDGEFVITSTNLGIAATNHRENEISFSFESRSSNESELDALSLALDRLAHILSMDIEKSARYPGWKRVYGTRLQEEYREAYKKAAGGELDMVEIHAGLECGLLASKKPGLDVISIGPDITGLHTPKETLDLASYERLCAAVYQLLVK
jgi:dipeptidase D